MNRILLTLVSVATLGAPVLAQMNHGGAMVKRRKSLTGRPTFL